MKKVLVEWEDSSSTDKWLHPHQLEEFDTPLICQTIGFLVARDKKRVLVASSTGGQGALGDIMRIPMACVKKVRDLK